ncbi:TetR/AcrR family transcriptional regulator [Isoptericola croceus]|uniref:TetR/AcrR family transcriptional regulator n=1 Tax=Isoptericola croceus TaxID=3031406 RepID=UPI0023F6712F|nr:TetR/AcrR family transcriptional regulator [Isoptericola croceus]
MRDPRLSEEPTTEPPPLGAARAAASAAEREAADAAAGRGDAADGRNVNRTAARDMLRNTLELLWHGWQAPAKGPRPRLTLDQIVAQAVAVADAEGLDALSMRRIARELDVGTMSLYRYVPTKDVLLNLMLDRVSEPAPAQGAAVGTSWRGVLETAAQEGRALYLRHPWLIQVNWTRPILGPSSVRSLEVVVAGLTDLPLRDQEKIMVITLLDAYVVGSVRQELLYEAAADETGLSEGEFWGTQLPYMEHAMASGAYPVLATLDEDSFDGGWDETFDLGVRLFLDGLEREVGRRTLPESH